MGPVKVTGRDYLIACVGLVPMLLVFAFREPLAVALGTTPKIIAGLGVIAAVLIMLGMSMLMARNAPRNQWPVKLWHRLLGVTILALGVAYFFAREEIAGALNWRIGFGDALAVFFAVIAVTMLSRHLPPLPTDREEAEGGPRPPHG